MNPVNDPTITAANATATATPPVLARTFRSLRHRDYRLYFVGQLVSLTGTWMQNAALAWLAYDLTGQSKWTAFVAVAQVVPTFALGFVGGFLADSFSRRGVLVATQLAFLATALALAVLVGSGNVTPWQLLGLVVLHGVVQAVDLPTRLAFVNELVEREDLPNAVALNAMLFNAARAVGPAIAGGLLVLISPAACFVANALSYAAVLVALGLMRGERFAASEPTPAGERGSLWSVFVYLAHHATLGPLVLCAGGMALLGWPSLSLLPAVASVRLGAAEWVYSTLLSCVGLGAISAALTVATVTTPRLRRPLLLTGYTLAAAGLIGLAWAVGVWQALASCYCLGFGLVMFFSTGQTVVQLQVAQQQRGRVLGIWAMTLSGAMPLGNLIVGPLADSFGTEPVLLAQGLLCLGLAAVAARFVRALDQGD